MTTFALMPEGRRTPGVYTELNTLISNRGLTPKPVTVLFIGQGDGGSAADGDLELAIESAADAWGRFGRRSHMAKMIAAAFKVNPGLNAAGMKIADAGGGVDWEFQITFSGTATADGTVEIEGTGGLDVVVDIANGDTAAQVATKVAAAIAAADWPDLPYLVAVDGVVNEQVNFTAVNAGTVGNTLSVAYSTANVTGIGGSDATVSGATDPVLQTAALDSLVSEDFDFICVALNDATNLGALRDHLTALVHPLVSLGSIGVYAAPGNVVGNATTLAAVFNTSGFMTGAFFPDSASWEPEIAGCYAGLLASQSDPALPYNNLQMTGLINPDAANKLSATEVETLLQGGVTPIVVGAGNVPRIVRAISTYQQTPSGASDDALLDVTTARSLFWLRFQITTALAAKFSQAKNTATRRAAIRAEILSILFLAEELEIVADVEANAEGVVVATNPGDATRVDAVVPAAIVRGLHLIVQRIDLTLPA